MKYLILCYIVLFPFTWVVGQGYCQSPVDPVPPNYVGLRANVTTPFCNFPIPSRLTRTSVFTSPGSGVISFDVTDTQGRHFCNLDFSGISNNPNIDLWFSAVENYTTAIIVNGMPVVNRVEDLLTPRGDGVSVIDIIILRNHILGTLPFDSPWQFMAGDSNGDNYINIFDMIGIQRFLLYNDPKSLHQSWDYRDKLSYDAFDIFVNQFDLSSISVDSKFQNVALGNTYSPTQVGVKVGDLNSTCSFYSVLSCRPGGRADVSNNKKLYSLSIHDRLLKDHESIEIPLTISLDEEADLSAIGLSILADESLLEITGIESEELNLSNSTYISDDLSEVKVLWVDFLDGYNGSIPRKNVSITLKARSLGDFYLSEAISLNETTNLKNSVVFSDSNSGSVSEELINLEWEAISQDLLPQVHLVSNNPFVNSVILDVTLIEKIQNAKIEGFIYDSNGRILEKKSKVVGSLTEKISFENLENLPVGMYFYKVNYAGKTLSAGKVTKSF